MRTRVTIKSRKYYTNEDKGTVTCVIKANCNISQHPAVAFIEYAGLYYDKSLAKRFKIENLSLDFTFTATARCSPLDEFDEKIGRRIAESKAKINAFRFFKTQFHRVSLAILWGSKELEKSSRACEYAEFTEVDHLEDLRSNSL